MIQRHLFALFVALTLLLGMPGGAAWASNVEISHIKVEATEEGYTLGANYDFELNRGLEDALTRGFALFFTTELELTRPRWYWFDEKAIVAKQTVRLSYNLLTRQYYVAVLGSLHQTTNSLEEALSLIRRPNRWLFTYKGNLKGGETYNGKLRMILNLEYQSKPIQINAINNSDWRLASDKITFHYKAEEK